MLLSSPPPSARPCTGSHSTVSKNTPHILPTPTFGSALVYHDMLVLTPQGNDVFYQVGERHHPFQPSQMVKVSPELMQSIRMFLTANRVNQTVRFLTAWPDLLKDLANDLTHPRENKFFQDRDTFSAISIRREPEQQRILITFDEKSESLQSILNRWMPDFSAVVNPSTPLPVPPHFGASPDPGMSTVHGPESL